MWRHDSARNGGANRRTKAKQAEPRLERPTPDPLLPHFGCLLDALAMGETCLANARVLVEAGRHGEAVVALSLCVDRTLGVLAETADLPESHRKMLGHNLARCLLARASALLERALSGEVPRESLRAAARADIQRAAALPPDYLNPLTRASLARVTQVLALPPPDQAADRFAPFSPVVVSPLGT